MSSSSLWFVSGVWQEGGITTLLGPTRFKENPDILFQAVLPQGHAAHGCLTTHRQGHRIVLSPSPLAKLL